MADVGSFLDALGGTQAVAIAVKVRPSAVSNWRKRNAIPPRLHAKIAALAAQKQVEFDLSLCREFVATSAATAGRRVTEPLRG